MLKAVTVKYKKKSHVIKFDNKLGRRLYGVDSVNLLLGENGTGKTTILREVASSFFDYPQNRDVNVKINGEVNDCGIVYFTPISSHRPFDSRLANHGKFVDASDFLTGKDLDIEVSFFKRARMVLKDFGIRRDIVGLVKFDCADALFNAFSKIALADVDRLKKLLDDSASPILSSARGAVFKDFLRLNALNSKYEKIRSNIQELERWTSENRSDPLKHKTLVGEKKKLSEISSLRWNLNNELKEEINYFLDDAVGNADYFFMRDGYFSGGAIDNIALLALCILKDKSAEDLFTILFSNERADHDVEALRRFVDDWIKINACDIRWGGRYLELKFDFVKGEELLKKDEFSYYRDLGLISIGLGNLSSGEEAILRQCLALDMAMEKLRSKGVKSILVIVDEGDMLLHLKWQRIYIKKICAVLSNPRCKDAIQLLIATHSAILASDVLKNSITCLDGRRSADRIKAFGAPISNIYNYDFGVFPVGAIAEREIIRLSKKNTSFSEEDRYLIGLIDDIFVREYFEGAKQYGN